jgi:predicted ATPase
LVTIAGTGGVGKTALAMKCAAELISSHEHGAWLVNLAPITDGSLVVPTILSSMEASASEQDGELAQLLEYLRDRDALLVLDNCEHLIGDVAAHVAKILANCPRVTILATSRELLHLNGEQVYRLGSLRPEAAVDLFMKRAAAASPGFDAQKSAQLVRAVCEHLDGIPLAIELAAARVRALTVDDIFARLHERFRLLTTGARTASPRQQTLAATIEWSYELLTPDEQSLFRRLSVFRGSFTLAAAAAVCANGEASDEFGVLDLLTSLVDKSLVTVTLALSSRYRLLETIREFASERAVEQQASIIAQQQHAGYFAAVAAQAYHEFDTQLPEIWLERLTPDLDNFRAALAWTLEGSGNRRTGAQLAADSGPVFLRMELLGEGLRWCNLARAVPGLPPATTGRIDYVGSMLSNNRGDYAAALALAESAVACYRQSSDERGLIRALSQVAYQYARAKRFEEAEAPSEEAIKRARLLGEPRVLIAVLRRCAYSLPPQKLDEAREYFTEARDAARSARDPEEAYMVLEWWAAREASMGNLERALEIAMEGVQYGGGGRLVLEGQIAGWALALNRFDVALPHALRALEMAIESQDQTSQALSIAYWSPFHTRYDAEEAALLFGYACARLAELIPQLDEDDRLAMKNAEAFMEAKMEPDRFAELKSRGAVLSKDTALAMLTNLSALDREGQSAALTGDSDSVGALLI